MRMETGVSWDRSWVYVEVDRGRFFFQETVGRGVKLQVSFFVKRLIKQLCYDDFNPSSRALNAQLAVI